MHVWVRVESSLPSCECNYMKSSACPAPNLPKLNPNSVMFGYRIPNLTEKRTLYVRTNFNKKSANFCWHFHRFFKTISALSKVCLPLSRLHGVFKYQILSKTGEKCKNEGKFSFTPLSKVCLLLHRQSYNSQLFNDALWRSCVPSFTEEGQEILNLPV